MFLFHHQERPNLNDRGCNLILVVTTQQPFVVDKNLAMDFNEIATVSGKGGLFSVVTPTKGGMILESIYEHPGSKRLRPRQ